MPTLYAKSVSRTHACRTSPPLLRCLGLCRSLLAVSLFCCWIERFGLIVRKRLDNSQPFCTPFTKQYPITYRQILRTLYEAEGYRGPVPGPDEFSVNIDDGACLRDGADMEHGLILGFDGSGMGQDQNLL